MSSWRATLVLMLGLAVPALAQQPGVQRFTRESTVDAALGNNARAQFAQLLSTQRYGGQVYGWEDYAAWGRELVHQARVARPPAGPAPSPLLSTAYRCTHCHNLRREDSRLIVQDPEVRERMIHALNPADPKRWDGETLFLATGTTLWGAVNRESFYNGLYAKYRTQKVASGKAMNPNRLADAITVCCRYCSGGRYPERWELDAMLAYLWELELRIKDVEVPGGKANSMLDQLNGDDVRAVNSARSLLRRSFLAASEARAQEPPVRSEGKTDIYADGVRLTGDATRGQFVYQAACAGCHGTVIQEAAGKELAADNRRFHRYIRHGTERDGVYMPLFSSQRLSRTQVADLRAYLLGLPQ